MSYMDECNTESYIRSILLRDELMGGKGGALVVLSPSAQQLPSSGFFQPVLGGGTSSKINNFKVMSLSSYTFEIWGILSRCYRQMIRRPPWCRLKVSRERRVNGSRLRSESFPWSRQHPNICLSKNKGKQWSGFASGIAATNNKRDSWVSINNY